MLIECRGAATAPVRAGTSSKPIVRKALSAMRLAVIADIHGNLAALEAVLADIAARGADLTIDLGDCVSGPLWPAETTARLGQLAFPTVRGNHDRQLATTPRTLMGASDAFAFDRLDRQARERLGALPETLVPTAGVLAVHGCPTRDTQYLTEDIVDGRMALARPVAILDRLGGAQAPLILCGHSHQPRVVHAGDGMLIVNPGSVGCPAYFDDAPPHASETGSPHARYALATRSGQQWRVELIAITYDWASAAHRAAESGRPDWARALMTGYVG